MPTQINDPLGESTGVPAAGTPGTIYLLHYTARTKRGRQHCLGGSDNPTERPHRHQNGRGAAETRRALPWEALLSPRSVEADRRTGDRISVLSGTGRSDDPILVTAQGLFPYFQRDQVHGLIAEIAERLPGSQLVFDVVPEAMLEMVRRASSRERDLAVELWPWLFNPRERAAIRAIPGIETLRDLAPPLTPNLAALGIAAISRLPPRLRYSLPVIQVLQATSRPAAAH
jgi:hypothetical protein